MYNKNVYRIYYLHANILFIDSAHSREFEIRTQFSTKTTVVLSQGFMKMWTCYIDKRNKLTLGVNIYLSYNIYFCIRPTIVEYQAPGGMVAVKQ